MPQTNEVTLVSNMAGSTKEAPGPDILEMVRTESFFVRVEEVDRIGRKQSMFYLVFRGTEGKNVMILFQIGEGGVERVGVADEKFKQKLEYMIASGGNAIKPAPQDKEVQPAQIDHFAAERYLSGQGGGGAIRAVTSIDR